LPSKSNNLVTSANPPLHANAAFVMFLAARRYDVLARKFQIAAEVRAMYADALAHASTDSETTLRDLYWCPTTGCGSCAMPTKSLHRSTRKPGVTKAGKAIWRATSSVTISPHKKRSKGPMPFYRVTREYLTSKSLPAAREHPVIVAALLILGVFAIFAVLMYRRAIPALLAVPCMAASDGAGGGCAVHRTERHHYRRGP